MTRDADLIGYLLDALDEAEAEAVRCAVRSDPALADRLTRLDAALAPLEADREPPPPPPGLVARTLARVAACWHPPTPARLAQSPRPAPREQPDFRLLGGRLRPDPFVAAGIALFACGLLFSGLGKLRAEYQAAVCQADLRTLYVGLRGQADTQADRLPPPSWASPLSADVLAAALARAGQLPPDFRPTRAPAPPDLRTAAPPLGRPAGLPCGFGIPSPDPSDRAGASIGPLQRPIWAGHDLTPIAFDRPPLSGGDTARPPYSCGFQLLAGGSVRFVTTTSWPRDDLVP